MARRKKNAELSTCQKWLIGMGSVAVVIVLGFALDGYRWGQVPSPDFSTCNPPQPAHMRDDMQFYRSCCGTSAVAIGDTIIASEQITSCDDW